ncbi:cell wall hydrolase [Sphingomonas sp. PAMC 26617]|uniref:cell wall hydrolase n=1 Tax=Sphingomonas sp. PAMC 26617 TaxID=1112216 RepID=UPI000288DA75|nr:cell wall hydrolase [Sphingomonas sp. PAMC 26617]
MIAHARLSTLYATAFIVLLLVATSCLIYLSTSNGTDVLAPGDLPPSLSPAPQPGRSPAPDLALETFLPQQTLALSTTQALAANLARPLAATNPTPPPFDPASLSEPDRTAATTCLATAIYYEAATEPVVGQQAVAQVVLNRLRNPHYPKTVCDVVYDGAQRRSGCQFTFTCDGSLARRPDPAGMARARAVAEAALHGTISFAAGQATHYHTVWIVPRWADALAKVAIIGHHVFYRPPRPYGGYPSATVATPTVPAPATTTGTLLEPSALATSETQHAPPPAGAAPAPAPDTAKPQPIQAEPTTHPQSAAGSGKTVFFPEARRKPSGLAIPSN